MAKSKSKSKSKKINKNNIKRVLKIIANRETKPLVNYSLYMFIFLLIIMVMDWMKFNECFLIR